MYRDFFYEDDELRLFWPVQLEGEKKKINECKKICQNFTFFDVFHRKKQYTEEYNTW